MQEDFSFSFSGGDIDVEDEELSELDPPAVVGDGRPADHRKIYGIAPHLHHLKELLLPYLTLQTLHISHALVSRSCEDDSKEHENILLPYRAPFDIRMALMASSSPPASPILSGVDLVPGTYEGGWQIWEGAHDLAAALEDFIPSQLRGCKSWRIIELGAGVGLPTLSIFKHLVQQPLPDRLSRGNYHITVSDYNVDVLKLSTTAALLLTWIFHSSSSPKRILGLESTIPDDIEIGPDVVSAFETDLVTRGIEIDAISGSWSHNFLELAQRDQSSSNFVGTATTADAEGEIGQKLLILASETLYSPDTLGSFMLVLMGLLHSVEDAEAYVASKTNYFGIGGNTVSFVREVGAMGGRAVETSTKSSKVVEGVKREVLKVVTNPRSSS